MDWQIIAEDSAGQPRVYSNDADVPSSVPLDGIQAIIIDGRPHTGYDRYFHVDDGIEPFWGFSGDTGIDILTRYSGPNTTVRICRGRTTTTARFHEVEKFIGVWSNLNRVPSVDWKKDVIGWRVWTSKNVFDSVGSDDWLASWAALPDDDIQIVMLYENWSTRLGAAYRQYIAGSDAYFMSPHPSGKMIIAGSNDADVPDRYPGAVLKRGKFMPLGKFDSLKAEAFASVAL